MMHCSTQLQPFSTTTHAATRSSIGDTAVLRASAIAERTVAEPESLPSIASAADEVASRLYAHAVQPALFEDLWGAIAEFLPGVDVLNLRTTSHDMVDWLDPTMTSFKASGDRTPQMLAALANAAHLHNIKKLSIYLCNQENFPAIITGLAGFPLEKIDVTLMRHRCHGAPLDHVGLALLREIRPASLEVGDLDRGTFSCAEVQGFAALDYPISLRADCYHYRREHEAELRALATIPQLTKLLVSCDIFSDAVAQVFQAHIGLRVLHLTPTSAGSGTLCLSNAAIAALASNATLRQLHIGETLEVPGAEGIAALAANGTLEELCVGTPYRPVEIEDVMVLSTNATLKQLQIGAKGGWGRLARIASLERLDVQVAFVSLDDAREFAQYAHLNEMRLTETAEFQAGSLAIVASSDIRRLSIVCGRLSAQDIDALLSNKGLRFLRLETTSPFTETVMHAIALAHHPTLEALVMQHVPSRAMTPASHAEANVMMEVHRMAMFAAWGPDRPRSTLTVNF